MAILLDAVADPKPQPSERVRTEAAVGRTLAAAVTATSASPPFDKAMMDGFALRRADHQTDATLSIAGEQAAAPGEAQPLPPGRAIRIMTGAPVPPEADEVVPVEQTEPVDGSDAVRLTKPPLKDGANILRAGSIAQPGQTIAAAGTRLAPHHLAALFEFGHVAVSVTRPLEVAVLTTGDELVPCDQTPGPGQIRNSNGPMLAAQIAAAGGTVRPLGIAGDDRDALAAGIRDGLTADVLVLSGGVSAGDYDFVPGELAAAGVEKLFHKVAVKPGKPVWAGVLRTAGSGDESDAGRPRFVFGLPGNPVSSFVCFELFVRPVLAAMAGQPVRRPSDWPSAELAQPFVQKGDRVTFWPAVVRGDALHPVDWKGSADLIGLAAANALMQVPAVPGGGVRELAAGERFRYRTLSVSG